MEFAKGNKYYDSINVLFNVCKKYNHPISDNEWPAMEKECRELSEKAGVNSFVWNLMIAFLNEKRKES